MKAIKKRYGVIGIAVMAVLLALIIVADVLCSRYFTTITLFFKDTSKSTNTATDLTAEEAGARGAQLSYDIMAEGTVLLKNDNNALPVTEESEKKITFLGDGSINPMYASAGSGATSGECPTFIEAFEAAGFEVNQGMVDFYLDVYDAKDEEGIIGLSQRDFTVTEPELSEFTDFNENIWTEAAEFSDIAAVVITRIGGEGSDEPMDMSAYGGSSDYHYLELQPNEEALIEQAKSTFKNVIVIINSSHAFELGFIDNADGSASDPTATGDIDACLWVGAPGSGLEAVADIVAGEVNPSGHLPDTYAYDLTSAPSYYNFGDYAYENVPISYSFFGQNTDSYLHYVYYQEGIYVGYRYYETRFIGTDNAYTDEEEAAYREVVQFPFGYGMSYTTFDQQLNSVTRDGDEIVFSVTVTNTGDAAGRDAVEIYVTPPYTDGGIEKSAVVLAAFAKTDVLAANGEEGDSQTLELRMDFEELASYDYKTNESYVIEAGDYIFSLRSDAHTVFVHDGEEQTYTFNQSETVIYNEENDGKRPSDEIVATNRFDFVTEGDGRFNTSAAPILTRADGDWSELTTLMAGGNRANAGYDAPDALKNSTTSYDSGYGATESGTELVLNNDEEVVTGRSDGMLFDITDMKGVDYDDPVWQDFIEQMTVEELNQLYSNNGWSSPAISSIGKIQSIEIDGPQGLHDISSASDGAYAYGNAYPSEPVMAATFNTDLIRRMGEAYGDEALAAGVGGLYAPGANLHRSPFGGRNGEYYSEDPLLSGDMCTAEVNGIQSKGIYVYIKHYALNDQETNRWGVCTWADEQAMREIYLRAFEIPMKQVDDGYFPDDVTVTGLMNAYNRVGAAWAGSNYAFSYIVPCEEWGWNGSMNTDAYNGDMAYAGSDILWALFGGTTMILGYESLTSSELAYTSVIAKLQEVAHRHMYIWVNSAADTAVNDRTPYWMIALVVLNVALVAGMATAYVLMVHRAFFVKK